MTAFLGVDGGGTKTAFALVDSDGAIRARAQLPNSDYLAHGVARVTEILTLGVQEVCRRAGTAPSAIDFAFFGLSGYGEVAASVPELDAAPAAVLGQERYRCDNDMVAGWAGSLGTQDGINVIAGTGSMAYGERAGLGIRVGGWGELFGDEGSGYWIGLRGLNAFTRMSDGRLPRGPLYGLLKDAVELQADLDLVDVVFHRWGKGRTEIAALSRLVADAAEAGDAASAEILSRAAEHLADLVDAARGRLGFGSDEPVPVSYSGGVFHARRMPQELASRLEERHPHYDLRAPLFEPVLGAAIYAAKTGGDPLSPAALLHLHTCAQSEQEPSDRPC